MARIVALGPGATGKSTFAPASRRALPEAVATHASAAGADRVWRPRDAEDLLRHLGQPDG